MFCNPTYFETANLPVSRGDPFGTGEMIYHTVTSAKTNKHKQTKKEIMHTKNCPDHFFSLDQEPQTELVAQLAQEFYNTHLFQQFLHNLHRLDFEVSSTVHHEV